MKKPILDCDIIKCLCCGKDVHLEYNKDYVNPYFFSCQCDIFELSFNEKKLFYGLSFKLEDSIYDVMYMDYYLPSNSVLGPKNTIYFELFINKEKKHLTDIEFESIQELIIYFKKYIDNLEFS